MNSQANLGTRLVTFTLIGAFLTAAAACGKSSRDNPDPKSRRDAIEASRKRWQEEREREKNPPPPASAPVADEPTPVATPITEPVVHKGGQPNAINLSGAMVLEDLQGRLSLAPNFSVTIEGGNDSNGYQQNVENDQLLKIKKTAETYATESDNQYGYVLNMGCTNDYAKKQAAKKPVKKLNETNSEIVGLFFGDKILICGDYSVKTRFVHFSAAQIVLNHANILFQPASTNARDMLNSGLFRSQRLTLVGNNKILSQNRDHWNVSYLPADITIEVKDKVDGTGSLYINSRGTNYAEPDSAEEYQ